MTDISVTRRITLALAGVMMSGYLLRPQVSQALVVRGDERLYRGSSLEALEYYRRAIQVDPLDASAVDRFAFGAVSLRSANVVREAIALSSAYLDQRPGDDVVRMDRAMAFRLIGDWHDAANDFERVGERQRDATALTFAGYAAERVREGSRARILWREALSIDPSFRAALRALHARRPAS